MSLWDIAKSIAGSVMEHAHKEAEKAHRRRDDIERRADRHGEAYSSLSKKEISSEYKRVQKEADRENGIVEDILHNRDDDIARKVALKRAWDEQERE